MISVTSKFAAANAKLYKQPVIIIVIAGYSRIFSTSDTGVSGQYKWIENIDDQGITINDLDGGADLGELTFTVTDVGGAITADFPGFVFEGKTVTLLTGFVGLAQTDFTVLFTGQVDSVASVNSNASYTFTCVDNKQKLSQVIYTTGDDGQPTDSDHLLTLNAHPLDLLLDIFRTELGIADSDIDVARIEDFRDGLLAGAQVTFYLDTAPAAKDFCEQQLLKPFAGYLWVNNLGQLSVNFFAAPATITPYSLTTDNTAEIPEAGQADMVNTVTYRFDKNTDGKYLAESVNLYGLSVSRYGQYGQQVIEADGVRSSLQGFFLAAYISRLIFLRYGLKNLKIEDLPLFWDACVLEPGDIVSLTEPHVPDRKLGVIGITNHLFEVLDRSYNFMDHIVTVALLDAGYLSSTGQYLIAPDGTAAWTSATTDQKAKYMFLANDSDQYSDATPAHDLS
jgi:hypothetical protein